MKNLDSLSKRILVFCIGICAILLFASLFVFAINNKGKDKNVFARSNPMQVATSGKYMMSYQAFVYSDGDTGYNVLVWDTETGKSRIYYYSTNSSKMIHWADGDLPANPLD